MRRTGARLLRARVPARLGRYSAVVRRVLQVRPACNPRLARARIPRCCCCCCRLLRAALQQLALLQRGGVRDDRWRAGARAGSRCLSTSTADCGLLTDCCRLGLLLVADMTAGSSSIAGACLCPGCCCCCCRTLPCICCWLANKQVHQLGVEIFHLLQADVKVLVQRLGAGHRQLHLGLPGGADDAGGDDLLRGVLHRQRRLPEAVICKVDGHLCGMLLFVGQRDPLRILVPQVQAHCGQLVLEES
mmetsp:Transcript_325/g.829  ORF Transcript_325/g.829 Transcript_325/m.829 type:complete len:246 (+) Transcript_325:482-1219(+)